jgi:hypothetical protein
MDIFDVFMVGIEVCVAFAGFSGIIATYQFGDKSTVRRGDLTALTFIVQVSLALAFVCIFPIILQIFGVEEQILWAATSYFGAALQVLLFFSYYKKMRGTLINLRSRLWFAPFLGVAGLNALLLILNANGLVFDREPGPVVLGISFGLAYVGYLFSRLLLRPLWRVVNAKESEMNSAPASG